MRPDRPSVQSVVKDRHRHQAHRRAHHVRKVLTPLLQDQRANHALQGRTRVRPDRPSVRLVLEELRQHLDHRPAYDNEISLSFFQVIHTASFIFFPDFLLFSVSRVQSCSLVYRLQTTSTYRSQEVLTICAMTIHRSLALRKKDLSVHSLLARSVIYFNYSLRHTLRYEKRKPIQAGYTG